MKAATYEEARDTRKTRGIFWQLLKRDAVRRSLRWSVPFALVLGLMIRGAAGDGLGGWKQLPFVGHHPEFIYLYIQLWLAVLFAVIIAHFNSRCSGLSLGLPITPRTLWFSRVVAIASAGLVPIGVVVAATASADATSILGIGAPLLPLGVRTAAGFVLAVVLFQLPSPGAHRIAGRRSYVIFVAVVSAAVLTYTVVTPGGWWWSAAPVFAAAVIAWGVGSRLPAGFYLAGADGVPAATLVPGAGVAGAGENLLSSGKRRNRLGRRWLLLRVIWRENLNFWPAWLMTLLILLTVWSLTATYYKVYHAPHDYITLLLWCWIFVTQSVRRLHRLDALPIGRHLIFYSLLVFMTVPAGLGLLTGYLVDYRLNDSPMTAVCYCDHTVRVPYDAWEVAWNGRPPEVSSPSGETYTPDAKRLVKHWIDVSVYNPFEIGKKSSPGFVAYQIDRAVARVHGPQDVSPPVSEVAGDSAFAEAVREGEYTVMASYRKDADLRIRTNAVTIMLWFIVFVVVNAVWWKRYRAEAEVVRTRWFAILVFGLPYVMLFGSIVLSARGILSEWAIVAFQMIALRSLAEAIPLGTGSLWIMVVLVALVCIVVLGRRFGEAEAPAPRSGKHLLSEY